MLWKLICHIIIVYERLWVNFFSKGRDVSTDDCSCKCQWDLGVIYYWIRISIIATCNISLTQAANPRWGMVCVGLTVARSVLTPCLTMQISHHRKYFTTTTTATTTSEEQKENFASTIYSLSWYVNIFCTHQSKEESYSTLHRYSTLCILGTVPVLKCSVGICIELILKVNVLVCEVLSKPTFVYWWKTRTSFVVCME